MPNKFKVTIPKEIIKLSKLNLNKPIFLCMKTSSFYLSNRKKHSICYGQIKLDDNYTFELPQNVITKLKLKPQEKSLFHVWLWGHTITFSEVFYKYEQKEYPSTLKIPIPDEISNVCKIKLNKPIYLCKDSRSTPYLTNSKFDRLSEKCLGAVDLDCENNIIFTQNMCIDCGYTVSKFITLSSVDNIIVLHEVSH